MTDRDIQKLIKSISEMARRVGAAFVPDEKKIAAIRRGRVSTPLDPSRRRASEE